MLESTDTLTTRIIQLISVYLINQTAFGPTSQNTQRKLTQTHFTQKLLVVLAGNQIKSLLICQYIGDT